MSGKICACVYVGLKLQCRKKKLWIIFFEKMKNEERKFQFLHKALSNKSGSIVLLYKERSMEIIYIHIQFV